MKPNQNSKSNSQKGLKKKISKKSTSHLKSKHPTCNFCGKPQIIKFSGQDIEYPVFYCAECEKSSSNEWEKWLDQYSCLYKKIENWDEKKNHISCIVGLFCDEFKKFYGYPYRFSYRSPIPFKDKTFVMARRLLIMFDGNAKSVGNFIKWVFKFKVKKNYQITSLGFFVSEKFQQQYNQAKARSRVLRRSTPLPSSFIDWCLDKIPEIFKLRDLKTWNDLNGCVSYVKYRGFDGVVGKLINEAIDRKLLPPGPDYVKLED